MAKCQNMNKVRGLFVIPFGPLLLKTVSPLDPHSHIATRNPERLISLKRVVINSLNIDCMYKSGTICIGLLWQMSMWRHIWMTYEYLFTLLPSNRPSKSLRMKNFRRHIRRSLTIRNFQSDTRGLVHPCPKVIVTIFKNQIWSRLLDVNRLCLICMKRPVEGVKSAK